MAEQIRGKNVIRHLTPGQHASVVAVVEGDAVVRVALPSDASQVAWQPRATTIRGVKHPALVRLMGALKPDVNTAEPAFIASEYIDGPLLTEVAYGLVEEEASRIVRSLAEGLAALHAAGVAHGRIHAGQVRLRDAASPVLLDVGATWGDPDATPAADVDMLIQLALSLPEISRRSALEDLIGTGASLSEVIGTLDGSAVPAHLEPPAVPEITPPAPTPSLLAPPEEEPLPPQRKVVASPPVQDRRLEDATDTIEIHVDAQPPAAEPAVEAPAVHVPVTESPVTSATPDTTAETLTDHEETSEPDADVLDRVAELLASFNDETSTIGDAPEELTAPSAAESYPQALSAPDAGETQNYAADLANTDEDSTGLPNIFDTFELAAPDTDITVDDTTPPPAPLLAAPRSEVPVNAVLPRPAFNQNLIVTPSPEETPEEVLRELAEARAAHDALAQQIASSANREQQLHTELIVARAEADAAAERIRHATSARTGAESELSIARAALAASENARISSEAQMNELSARAAASETNAIHLAAAEAAAAATETQLRDLYAEVTALRSRAAGAEAEVQTKDAQIAALNEQLTTKAREVVALDARVQELGEVVSASSTPSAGAQADSAERDDLLHRAETAEGVIADLRQQLQDATARMVVVQAQLNDASGLSETSDDRIARAESAAEAARLEAASATAQAQALRRLTTDLSVRLAGNGIPTGEDPRVAVLTRENESLTEQIAALRAGTPSLTEEQFIERVQRITQEKLQLSQQVQHLSTALQEASSAYDRAIQDANEARNALAMRTGNVLAVTAEPATPTVAVVDPQHGPAGPGLVAALRTAELASHRATVSGEDVIQP